MTDLTAYNLEKTNAKIIYAQDKFIQAYNSESAIIPADERVFDALNDIFDILKLAEKELIFSFTLIEKHLALLESEIVKRKIRNVDDAPSSKG